jgi:hypothetical protein
MRRLYLLIVLVLGINGALCSRVLAQPVTPVAPGTVAVHLNGRLQFEFADYGSTFNQVGNAKLSSVSTDGDMRLYPGFDAETLNGVGYGTYVEIRTTQSDAGVGGGKVSGTAGAAGTEGLWVFQAYGYIGTKQFGYIRLGQGGSAFNLLQAGVLEAFGDGAQWHADGGVFSMLPTNAAPAEFYAANVAPLIATSKIVYVSPSFGGLSFAAGYEPNTNGLKEGFGSCTAATSTCAALSSSPVTTDIGKRRRNTVDGMVQYVFKSDGVVYKTSGGFLYAAPIAFTGAPTAVGTATHFGFDNLEVYQLGGQAAFAGLTLGANIKGGQVEDGYAFKPRGARDGLTYIIGATYVVGPYVLGASYFNGQTAGSFVPGSKTEARTLSEYGVAIGGNYVLSKDLSLFVQYLYGHRHQPGNTLLSVSGNAQVQAIGAGGTFYW